MPITSNIDIKAIMEKMSMAADKCVDNVVTSIEAACIEVVSRARLVNTYQDQTGNLRSSIGYVIYKDGMRVHESFEAHPHDDNGEAGVKQAKDLCASLATDYAGRTVAIVVAGMDYAVYVESRGLDVVTGSMNQFVCIFEQYMKAQQQ